MNVRGDFPILSRALVYLDSAATSQKPRAVLSAMQRYYENTNANVHRSVYRLAEEAGLALDAAREAVRRFIGARSADEIVFTRGTTESINLVAHGFALRPGDEIVVTQLEHHANLLPWQRAARRSGARLRILPVDARGRLQEISLRSARLLAFSLVSNVLGSELPARELIAQARKAGAAVLIDAAQAAPHLPLSVADLDCDFLAFSGHKMLGPTGIGVLWAKSERLAELEPLLLGGGMVREVFADRAEWLPAPAKFEAGTPPVAEAVGLHAAIDYLQALGMKAVEAHARELAGYAVERLRGVEGITVYAAGQDHVGPVSFNVRAVHPHDLAAFLDERGICVRAGHHCAQPLMKALGVAGTVRASVQVYTTRADIDALISALRRTSEIRGHDT